MLKMRGTFIGLTVAALSALGSAAAKEAMTPFERAVVTPRGELKSPYPDVASVAKEGHKIYLSHDCNGCHGGGGGGGMAAPLTNVVWIYGDDDDTLFRVIALGTGRLSPGDAFAANPYPTILPSDTVFNPAASGVPVNTGSDALGDLWSTDQQPGVMQGLAFGLTDATDSFDFRVLATGGYGGGVAFSFALPAATQVPEPQSLALMLAALAICGGISARRKSIGS